MKTLENMKSMLMALVCLFTMATLSSCSDDDDPQNTEPTVAGYRFEITFTKDQKSDHADIVNTTCQYLNTKGEIEEKTIPEKFSNTFSIKSQTYTTLPGELKLIVKEELKPDVTLSKESYTLGLGMSLRVYSVNSEGGIIAFKEFGDNGSFTISKENVMKYYPRSHSFFYAINEEGSINEVK